MAPIMRDISRLLELIPRAHICPLGCGALAGNAFGVDRQALAADLGEFLGTLTSSANNLVSEAFATDSYLVPYTVSTITHATRYACHRLRRRRL